MFRRKNRRFSEIDVQAMAGLVDALSAMGEVANGYRLRLVDMGFQPAVAEMIAAQVLVGMQGSLGAKAGGR